MSYVLQIPPQPLSIVSSGRVDNGLIFLYELSQENMGPSLDDSRLSITKMPDDDLIKELEEKENCNYKLLLKDVFLDMNESGCSEKAKSAYSNVMIKDTEYGAWPSQDLDIYFANGEESLVIIIGVDKPNLLIQTNFMEKDQLKEVVSHYLQ